MAVKKTSIFRTIATLAVASMISVGDIVTRTFNVPWLYNSVSQVALVYFCTDWIGLDIEFVGHHVVAALVMLASSFGPAENLDLYYRYATLEYSTVFINLYHLTKKEYYKILFVLTWFYYRTYLFTKWVIEGNWVSDVEYVCTDHPIYNGVVCKYVFTVSNVTITTLNFYWSYLICEKISRSLSGRPV